MNFELCTDSVEGAIKASQHNFRSIELCSALGVGGLTPGFGLIQACCEQSDLEVEIKEGEFLISNHKIEVHATKLIIATGGLVLPQIGASDFGHKLAKRVGHKIIPMVPALVPFKYGKFRELAGNAFIIGLSCNNHYVAENVLFTHKGLSGPGILKTSLFWNNGDEVVANWLPSENYQDLIKRASSDTQVGTILKKVLPNKFVSVFLEIIGIDETLNIARLSRAMQEKLELSLHSMVIIPEGTEGFRKAEVTRGGICTKHVSSKTLESKLCPGLQFIGEVLDVTGQLGGHNFQWCWASAKAVGEALK